MSLISADNNWALWAIITGCAALSIILEKKFKWAAKMSALVIVLLLGILLSNIRVIPTEAEAYDIVWNYLVPLALPLLLFKVNLKEIIKESGQMLIAFLLGTVGTVVGSFIAYILLNSFVNNPSGVTAMFTGTYIGGSVNFMALADTFSVSPDLVSAATIADNFNMAIYIFVLLAIPVRAVAGAKSQAKVTGGVQQGNPKVATPSVQQNNSQDDSGKCNIKEQFSAVNLGICIAMGFIIVAASTMIADLIGDALSGTGASILGEFLGNKYLWITTISVILATAFPKFFGSIVGGQEIGTFLIYCFMFVIGAPASIVEIVTKSPILLAFALIIVAFNMLFTFTGGKLFKLDRDLMIIASNANIGGPTTAASMAIAKGWDKLVGPALLIGSFGYVLGNYLGMVVGFLCEKI